MKNDILFYYNLYAEDIISKPAYISFYTGYDKYYLVKSERPESDIYEIINIIKNLKILYHTIILNRNNKYYTMINKESFVLLKINAPENEILELSDILKLQTPFNRSKCILNRTNWGTLWSEKVDYLEYQVSELAIEHHIIKSSFSYYVGLAENAISYFNMLNVSDVPIFITHRRVEYPVLLKDILNPLDIVIDYRVRDIASYLKSKFFKSDMSLTDIKYIIKSNYLSPIEYNLLFVRLLYPSYYFDTLYRVLEKGLDEENLLTYINKVNDYEKFLSKVHEEFSHVSTMIKIDWLTSS